MHNIGRRKFHVGGARIGGWTYRDMKLVGGDDVVFRIAKLPPELVTYNDDIERGLAAPGASWTEKSTRAVVRKSTTMMRMGMIVQESSICTLP